MQKVIDIKNISKSYKEIHVLKNISFSIHRNEFIVLLGPSGCGKSTLLNIIAGLIIDYQGTICINGENVNKKHPKDRNIGFVFQNYALYPNMSVYENLAFSLKFKDINSKEFAIINQKHQGLPKKAIIDLRVKEIANLLQIGDILSKYPNELSGGQSQRVAIGRALVRKPDLFLFDEPLSNLDAKLRRKLRSEIKKIHQLINTSVIYVTHDQEEALTLADRIVVLDNGVINQIGTPKDIYHNPSNIFVAKFIGNPPMNIFKLNDSFFKKLISDNSDLSEQIIKEFTSFDNIGIRPELITTLKKGKGDIKIGITFDYEEYVGDKKIIHAILNNSKKEILFFDNVKNNSQEIKEVFININNINKFKQ